MTIPRPSSFQSDALEDRRRISAEPCLIRRCSVRAIREVADKVVGLDLYAEGESAKNATGGTVVHGDAEVFQCDQTFDAFFAGDLIGHPGNFDGFITSAKA